MCNRAWQQGQLHKNLKVINEMHKQNIARHENMRHKNTKKVSLILYCRNLRHYTLLQYHLTTAIRLAATVWTHRTKCNAIKTIKLNNIKTIELDTTYSTRKVTKKNNKFQFITSARSIGSSTATLCKAAEHNSTMQLLTIHVAKQNNSFRDLQRFFSNIYN